MSASSLHRLAWPALCAGLLLSLGSCNRDKDDFGPDYSVSAEDQADAVGDDNSTYEMVDAAAPAEVNGGTAPSALDLPLLGCATRTYNAATRTLTIDFGTTGCVGRDGRLRKGQIVAVFTGQHRQTGSSVTITLVNFSVNDNARTGTRTITFIGDGSYTIDVQNASITTSVGTAAWSSQRRAMQTAGQGTRTVQDDVYSITGVASGVNRRGVTFTATIQDPLIRKFQTGCARYFVAGTVQITTSKQRDLLLNYDPSGTQACDNVASVTINGRTRTITLR